MEGNIVKAAWVLGGSILASVALGGIGLFVGLHTYSKQVAEQLDITSRRTADAMIQAAQSTRVGFRTDETIKVGFEPKLPAAVRVENSMDEKRGTRAVFEVDVKPTLSNK